MKSHISDLAGGLRTHHCGQLTLKNLGQEVTLCGWVNKYRDLGSLHFIDIRDKFGLTQLGFEKFPFNHLELKELSLESVITIVGEVCARPDSAKNLKMGTGEIEVQVKKLKILSKAQELPFLPFGSTNATEDLRLKYRYLDLRTNRLQDMLALRSEMMQKTRATLCSFGFTEVETPILYKTTPEGARDYIVPSRVHPGRVYALPQSPQTLKQLLMISGLDKYFQICRCFRDEDLRADRQPEFSQIDIEVSFLTQEYIKNLASEIVKNLFNLKEFDLPVISYAEVMDRFGSDKPDIRYDLEQRNVTAHFKDSSFSLFKDIASGDGLIKVMFFPLKYGNLSRADLDGLKDIVAPYGGKGVAYLKSSGGEFSGPMQKYIPADLAEKFLKLLNLENKSEGWYLFFADKNHDSAHNCADAVRRHLAHKFKIFDENEYKFLWVNDFPLFDYDQNEDRFYAKHHPFTMPKAEFVDDFMSGDSKRIRPILADAYDIVCNGYEIGGGSLRIYDSSIQAQMFRILGLSEEDAKRQFGFFIEALQYGTPPHGGMAFGLDRLVMLKARTDNIRDVMAFPKTASATDLMSQAPSIANPDQLKELKMKFLE